MRKSEGIQLGRWRAWLGYAVGALAIALYVRAAAAGQSATGAPALLALQSDLHRPLPYAITVAAFIGSGVVWALDGSGGVRRKYAALVLGGALALGAVQLLTALFPARM